MPRRESLRTRSGGSTTRAHWRPRRDAAHVPPSHRPPAGPRQTDPVVLGGRARIGRSSLQRMAFSGWPKTAFTFYEGLEADNSRAYWHANKATYDNDVKAPFAELSAQVEKEFGPLRVFRPNRDTRFAKD